MQHTLLPPTERSILRREYRIRAVVVLLFMIACAGTIGAISLLPAFLHASFEANSVSKKTASLKGDKDAVNTGKIESELAADAALAEAVSGRVGESHFSDIVKSIVSARGTVRITSFSLEYPSSTTMRVVVAGIAPNRSALLSFKSALGGILPQTTADLPISELAKSKDIPFSITLTK